MLQGLTATENGRVGAVAVAELLRVRQRPTELSIMRQLWRHLAFLHWPVAPDALAPLLPPGLDLDTFDGRAYVGLVPFTILGTRPPFAPALPGFSDFHEVNVRTYVHRAGRDPGVWFFSLDAASRLTVAGARLVYKLPYHLAAMSMKVQPATTGDVVDFTSRRAHSRRGAPAHLVCSYHPTGAAAPASPGSLAFYLAERYLLYSWNGRHLRTARVFHQPYPLQSAAVSDPVDETLTAAAGISRPVGPPPLVHYAREVNVRIYRPRVVSPTSRDR